MRLLKVRSPAMLLPRNPLLFIVVRAGMVADVMDVQPSNTYWSMLVSSGKLCGPRLEHPLSDM